MKKTKTTSIRTRATLRTESTDSGGDTASEDATACVTDDDTDIRVSTDRAAVDDMDTIDDSGERPTLVFE